VRLRRERDQPDLNELAAERLRTGIEPFEPLPPQLRRYDRKRLLMFIVMGALAVAILRDGLGRGAPPVTGSCTQPGFAFDRQSVVEEGVVKWAVVGPTGASVIVTADSTSPDQGRLLGPVPLKDCKADGRFGVPLKDGTHVLRVFLRSPDGAVSQLGSKSLEVDAPH
jgi:hypothetical protein